MLTVLEIIKRTTEFLGGKGVESPRLNAELLVGHALARKRMQLYMEFERPLTEAELEKIRPLVRRRAQHEPLQYITGETEFFGLTLKCDRRALIARPETELLAELVVAACPAPARVLDLGTGSGALALALAKTHPAAEVTAVDASPEALALAAENAAANGLAGRVAFLRSDWFSALPAGSRFDLVIANPPYLSATETAATALEVRGFEPAAALTAAEDGISDLRRIIAAAPAFLVPGGLLALETGIAHHAELGRLVAAAGLERFESRQDLTKRDRYVFARAPGA
ncbi:MAG: protein-(glutamine-N5) methyltransferase, release factor-specific [Opitutia bacterium Tous-C1TDCM]|nr:MAG: protein-(glutamine-N5) methyltransferase, release factor-specific [Opitutae bacterium Tous-C1TDCM]